MSVYPDEATIGSPRLLWYNPKLDPTLSHKMTPAMIKAINEGTYDDGTVEQGGPLNIPDEWHEANLVSSLCADGLHRPTLDIDFEHTIERIECITYTLADLGIEHPHVIPSARGNCHVYAERPALQWEEYVQLLWQLECNDLIEDRYLNHSLMRGQTLLRLPGVPKLAYTAGDITTAVDNDGRLVFGEAS